MDFGRLANIDAVDWRLPQESLSNTAVLGRSRLASGAGPGLWVGTVGWGYRKWVGSIYPPKTAAHDYLKAYARAYKAVELNATFYRVPQVEQAESWAAQTPEDFRFSPKVTQTLSHVQPLGGSSAQVEEFVRSVRAFGERLGLVLLQLPPDFSRRREYELASFLDRVGGRLPLAVEFRHASFFRRQALEPDTRRLLERHGVAVVISETAGRRDVMHVDLTAPRSLIRFLGNELHESDYRRIDAWAQRIADWFKAGLQDLHFFVHQPNNSTSPPLLEYVLKRFGEATGLETLPRTRREPQLGAGSPQLSLFE